MDGMVVLLAERAFSGKNSSKIEKKESIFSIVSPVNSPLSPPFLTMRSLSICPKVRYIMCVWDWQEKVNYGLGWGEGTWGFRGWR